MSGYKNYGGSKYETKDGAFSNNALKNRKGDGYTPRKAKRKINKKIRQFMKKMEIQ